MEFRPCPHLISDIKIFFNMKTEITCSEEPRRLGITGTVIVQFVVEV